MTNSYNKRISIINKFKLYLFLISLAALACSSSPSDGGTSNEIEDEFEPIDIPAEMIFATIPNYPQALMDAGIEGVVWVQALVQKDGSVGDAGIAKTSGHSEFDQAALEAAWTCRYNPGIQNDKPVAMWVTYRVDFKLGH